MPELLESKFILETRRRLVDAIRIHESCVVAFSGGVDSSVVAQAAFEACGDRAIAITGTGPSVSQEDIRSATLAAQTIGIRHLLQSTTEIIDPQYLANDPRRCFHCKTNLYGTLRRWANENGFATLLSGTNADDLGDYRPGLDAADDFKVVAPLAELGIDKKTVRLLAEHGKLPVADRPASPCLASRVAYGESITTEKLQMIEQAEAWLASQGFHDVRVRLHPGLLARIEVSTDDLSRMVSAACCAEMNKAFRKIGFQFVTLDVGGRQSGSMNRLLPILQNQK
jgi:pyridinium-3,5-biscarboxylic acid mononucleotide sulfurtransferase